MRDILTVFVILLGSSFPFLGVAIFASRRKKDLAPLLSIIQGRIYSKFRVAVYGVVEGSWRGEKVKVEAAQYKSNVNCIISLLSLRPLPFSLKVRPTSGIFGLVDMSVTALVDGHRFKIPEANVTVYSPVGDETMIRQFLNPARLAIIRNIFSCCFNCLEIHTDPINGGYLKVSIEARRLPMMKSNPLRLSGPYEEIYQAAIQPEAVGYILEKLKEFETAEQHSTLLTDTLSVSLSGS